MGAPVCAWTLVESRTDTGAEIQTWADCSGRKGSIPLKKILSRNLFLLASFCACDRESDPTPIERSGVAFSGNIRERLRSLGNFQTTLHIRRAALT
jgi:hypothetical protein